MQQISLFPCGFHEEKLIASALGEADATVQKTVQSHIRRCPECQRLFQSYSTLNQLFTHLPEPHLCGEKIHKAREKLDRILVPKPVVRLRYGIFSSAVGTLCIVRSAQGVSFVGWSKKTDRFLSQCESQQGVTVEEDGEELRALFTELQAYLAGERDHLDWPIDDMLLKSTFQQDVFKVLSEVPYGAVMSYQGIAEALGRPKAVRAVAQALRWNPVAIVIPCHRVVGSNGHLTGYAGGLEIKRKLLALEGIPLQTRTTGAFIDREHMYVGWRLTREYCRPTCPSLKNITPGNTILLSSRTASEHLFVPCETCHPELASSQGQ